MIEETLHVVQLINASLPHEWRLNFSNTPGPAGAEEPAEGEILFEFLPRDEWPESVTDPPDGRCRNAIRVCALRWPSDEAIEIAAGRVLVDPERVAAGQEPLQAFLAFGIVYTLGRNSVVATPVRDTIMARNFRPGHILFPLDREMLLAACGEPPAFAEAEYLATRLGP